MPVGIGSVAAAGYRHGSSKKNKGCQPREATHTASSDTSSTNLDREKSLSEHLESKLKVNQGHWFLDRLAFHAFIGVAIVLNTVQIGMSCDLHGEHWDQVWHFAEHVFTFIFTVEAAIKIYFLRAKYFQDRWNLLDFAFVSLAVLDIWILALFSSDKTFVGDFTILRVLRVCRSFRAIRMLKMFSELVILIEAIGRSFKTMAWVMILILFIIFFYAVILADIVGTDETYPAYSRDTDILDKAVDNFNNYQYFGTLMRSAFSLFSLITLSEWSDVSRPISEYQPIVVPILVSFVLLTAFGVLNVAIGVMVEHALQVASSLAELREEQNRQVQMNLVEKTRTVMERVDQDHNGVITREELQHCIEESDDLALYLAGIDFPIDFTLGEMLLLIDESGDGLVSPGEFMSEMGRLVNCTAFQHRCLLQMSMNKLKVMSQEIRKEMMQNLKFLVREIRSLREEMREVHALGTGVPVKPKPLDGATNETIFVPGNTSRTQESNEHISFPEWTPLPDSPQFYWQCGTHSLKPLSSIANGSRERTGSDLVPKTVSDPASESDVGAQAISESTNRTAVSNPANLEAIVKAERPDLPSKPPLAEQLPDHRMVNSRKQL